MEEVVDDETSTTVGNKEVIIITIVLVSIPNMLKYSTGKKHIPQGSKESIYIGVRVYCYMQYHLLLMMHSCCCYLTNR